MKDRIEQVADLLLGAAYADENLDGYEREAVLDLLSDVLGEDELPDALEKRVEEFDPDAFDLRATVSVFKNDSDATKRKLLELVVAVHEADQELDLSEDEYVKDLALALGLPEKAYADLTLDIEIEDLQADLAAVRKG
ncbi:MAG: TerB family tellurite resistance protein [Deltaproteobacteria bacterium]|nr:TerB family tellurite resistance protein [Deltaproteobacteria bacterium]